MNERRKHIRRHHKRRRCRRCNGTGMKPIGEPVGLMGGETGRLLIDCECKKEHAKILQEDIN